MSHPEIRIKKSFLLNDRVIPLLKSELNELGRQDEASSEYIDSKVHEYKSSWSAYEERIVPALCEALGVEFKQNIIDIYVAPFSNSFSDPMIISTKYSSDRVVDVITHEIIHRLLTDNNKLPLNDGRKLSEHWLDAFGSHDFITLVHIPVHALLKYVYIDLLLEPQRLERDVAFCQKYKPYHDAWDYVENAGYKNIIAQLRSAYLD